MPNNKIKFLFLLILINTSFLSLWARELAPDLRTAEHLFNSGSLNSAREIALKVHKYFPQNLQALLILIKIDFKNKNYKSGKKWLRNAYAIDRKHPLILLYLSLLRDIEHRFGIITSDSMLVRKSKSQLESVRDLKKSWFGPNFTLLSKPSNKHNPNENQASIATGAVRLATEKTIEEKTVFEMALNALKHKQYMKSYLFFSQLLESKFTNRDYRLGKAKSAFHMKRYREVVEILGPYVDLSPQTFTKNQLLKANQLLEQSRKHVYRKQTPATAPSNVNMK